MAILNLLNIYLFKKAKNINYYKISMYNLSLNNLHRCGMELCEPVEVEER